MSPAQAVAHALVLAELDEARSHLNELIAHLVRSGDSIDTDESKVLLAHIYAHLNRCWNTRDSGSDIPEGRWQTYSAFPTDIVPIG